MLTAAGWNHGAAPVYIQSFEVSNLQELNQLTDIRLVQLIDADDVKPDGSMSLVAPFAQPYDFVVAGDPRTFADLLTPAGLDSVNDYADGVGPWKPYLLRTRIFDPNHDGVADDRNGDGVVTINDREVVGDTGVIAAAHDAGLAVHAFTFRNDASQYGFSDPIAEYKAYYAIGVDGVFSDFPDTALAARLMANVAALPIAGPGAEGIRRGLQQKLDNAQRQADRGSNGARRRVAARVHQRSAGSAGLADRGCGSSATDRRRREDPDGPVAGAEDRQRLRTQLPQRHARQ